MPEPLRDARRRRRRRVPGAIVALVLVTVAGIAALAFGASADDRVLAFESGTPALEPVAELGRGQRACQGPLDADERFSWVSLAVGTGGSPGPPLEVTVLPLGSGRPARVAVPGGYPGGQVNADVGLVPAGTRMRVCARNRGSTPILLLGRRQAGRPTQSLTVDGRRVEGQLGIAFLYREPRSLLDQLPDVMQRAAVWGPGWVGAWTFWLLLGLVAIGVPALLMVALRSTSAADPERGDRPAAAILAPDEQRASDDDGRR